MSMYEQLSSKGATASRRTSDHPTFTLCARLLEADPTGSYAIIKKKWVAEVREDPDLLDDVLTYAFRNYFTALSGVLEEARMPDKARRAKVEQEKAKIREQIGQIGARIEEAIQVKVLKSFLLPNGLVAWEATCGDLAQYGGFLGRIAKLGRPSTKVATLPLSKLKKIATP